MKNEFDKLFESYYGITKKDFLSFDSLCDLIEEQSILFKPSNLNEVKVFQMS